MAEFRYDPNRKAVVRVVEQEVGAEAEAELQAELDTLQNIVNERGERHTALEAEWEELERQSAAKSEEVEGAKVALLAAEEDLKSAADGRKSLAAALALQQELAQSSPETETPGDEPDETEEVDITDKIHLADEAPA